jgi:hypothetical protein
MDNNVTYKAFNNDFSCRGFQYEIGKEYEITEKPVRCTKMGFHSCKQPLDVFKYTLTKSFIGTFDFITLFTLLFSIPLEVLNNAKEKNRRNKWKIEEISGK